MGAKKTTEHEETVLILLEETATESVLSLSSCITASDMREVRVRVSVCMCERVTARVCMWFIV